MLNNVKLSYDLLGKADFNPWGNTLNLLPKPSCTQRSVDFSNMIDYKLGALSY